MFEVKPNARAIGVTRRSVSGVYMFKGEAAVPFESTLERDFLIRLEYCPDVLDVTAQPVTINYRDANGRAAKYTPDYLVHFKLGSRDYEDYPRPLLVEVKPEVDWRANWRKWSGKWSAARRYAKSMGWSFRVHDESRIRDQVFVNIRFLERYRNVSFPEEESGWIVSNVESMGTATFDYLLARHFMGAYRANGVSHLWHLVATRKLTCDMTRPLNSTTELWVAQYE